MKRIKRQPQTGTLISIATSIILSLTLASSALAEADKANDDRKAKKPQPTITEILAERNFVKGEVARRIRTESISSWRYLDN